MYARVVELPAAIKMVSNTNTVNFADCHALPPTDYSTSNLFSAARREEVQILIFWVPDRYKLHRRGSPI